MNLNKVEKALVFRPEEVVKLPYEAFVEMLLRKHDDQPTTVMQGHARWSGLPVKDILAAGAYLAMQKIAKKLNMPFKTEKDILKMALILDRMLGGGLLFCFESIEEVVEDFEQNVLHPMQKESKVSEGISPAINNGQVHCANWMVRIVKRTDTMVRDLAQEFVALEHINKYEFDPDAFCFYIKPPDIAQFNFHVIDGNALDEPLYTVHPGSETEVTVSRGLSLQLIEFHAFGFEVQNIREKIAITRKRVEATKSLPFGEELWRYRTFSHEIDFVYNWLLTQVLLEVVAAPDRNHILLSELKNFFKQRDECALPSLIPSVINRLKRLGWNPSQNQQNIVEEILLSEVIPIAKSLRSDSKVTQAELFLDIDTKAVQDEYNHEQCLQIALAQLPPRRNQNAGEAMASYHAFLQTTVIAAIDWQKITLHDVGEMISREIPHKPQSDDATGAYPEKLPLELLLDPFLGLPEEIRQEALEMYLDASPMTEKLWNTIALSPGFVLRNDLLSEYIGYHGKEIAEEYGVQVILAADYRDPQMSSRVMAGFFYKLSKPKARAIFRNPRVFIALITDFFSGIFNTWDLEDIAEIADHFGKKLWQEYMLFIALIAIDNMYSNYCSPTGRNDLEREKSKERAIQDYIPWTEMWKYKPHQNMESTIADFLGLSEDKAKKLFMRQKEDAVLSRCYATAPENLEEFLEMRSIALPVFEAARATTT